MHHKDVREIRKLVPECFRSWEAAFTNIFKYLCAYE